MLSYVLCHIHLVSPSFSSSFTFCGIFVFFGKFYFSLLLFLYSFVCFCMYFVLLLLYCSSFSSSFTFCSIFSFSSLSSSYCVVPLSKISTYFSSISGMAILYSVLSFDCIFSVIVFRQILSFSLFLNTFSLFLDC